MQGKQMTLTQLSNHELAKLRKVLLLPGPMPKEQTHLSSHWMLRKVRQWVSQSIGSEGYKKGGSNFGQNKKMDWWRKGQQSEEVKPRSFLS